MTSKCRFISMSNRIAWSLSLIVCLVLSAACQGSEPALSTPPILPTITIESSTPITNTTIAVTSISITPTPLTSLTPTATPIDTATSEPSPTVSPFQMLTKLPINATNLTISPDGALLAIVDQNTGNLYVYETENWELKWEIEEKNRGMTGYVLDFSPNGDLLAGAGTEQDVYVWDMDTGRTIHIFSEPYDTVNSASFSPDGELLAISSLETHTSPRRVIIWDVKTGEKLPDQFSATDYGWYVVDTIFIPNHPNLLAMTTANFRIPEEYEEGHKPGGLYFLEIDNQQIHEVLTGMRGTVVATSSNGQLIAAQIDDYLRVWDLQDSLEIFNARIEDTREIWNIALTDTGIIAALDTDWTLTIWELSGELLTAYTSDKIVSDIAFTPDGELLVAYLADKTPIEVWKITK